MAQWPAAFAFSVVPAPGFRPLDVGRAALWNGTVKPGMARTCDNRVVVQQRRAARAAFLAVVVATACTDYEPASDTLAETTDGMLNAGDAPLGAGANDWACLADVSSGPSSVPMNTSNAEPATYVLPLIDFVSGMAPLSARGRACARVDPGCSMPLTESVMVSREGALVLPLFEGFDGFIEVEADNMVPALFFLNAPLIGNTQSFPAFLVPLNSALALSQIVGVPIDERFGLIGFWALDCGGLPAEGVVMSNDAGGLIYNFVDGLPAFQTATVDGIGGFVNVPPGRVLLRGVLSQGGQTIGVQSLVVREGWISVSNVQPQL
jgi:hypothetical protein